MITVVWIVGVALLLLVLVIGGLVVFSARTARQVEKAVPPLGRFIDVDGARIHYLDEGSGPPLLLIHGLAGQMRHFTHSLLDLLKSDYRVVIVDRPGSGYSTRPEQVAGLALIAPATHPQDHVPPVFRGLEIRSRLLRRLVAWTLAIPMSIAYRDLVLGVVFGPQPVPADFATKGGGLLVLRPRSFIAASRDLVAATEDFGDMPARYQSLEVPVGILFGASDRILDPAAHGEALAKKLPGADFELHEGGGH